MPVSAKIRLSRRTVTPELEGRDIYKNWEAMVAFLHDGEIRYAAVMQRKDWVPCSSARNCTPTSFREQPDNTLFGDSRQMNHETALGTFRLAKFWEYWILGWSLFDSVEAEHKIRKTLQCFGSWIDLNAN